MLFQYLEKQEEVSFLLVKPDAYKQENIYLDVYNNIEKEGLDILFLFVTKLNNQMITKLWPKYIKSPITKSILENYLENRNVEVIILSGIDTIKKTTKIKRKIRSVYSKGAFANVLHSPDSHEVYTQLKILLKIEPSHNDNYSMNYVSGLWGETKKFSDEYIKNIINKLWHRDLGIDFSYLSNEIENFDEGLYLINDNNNSFDYVVSCIYDIFHNLYLWDLNKVILIALFVDKEGKYPLISIKNPYINEIEIRLNNYGLKTERKVINNENK